MPHYLTLYKHLRPGKSKRDNKKRCSGDCDEACTEMELKICHKSSRQPRLRRPVHSYEWRSNATNVVEHDAVAELFFIASYKAQKLRMCHFTLIASCCRHADWWESTWKANGCQWKNSGPKSHYAKRILCPDAQDQQAELWVHEESVIEKRPQIYTLLVLLFVFQYSRTEVETKWEHFSCFIRHWPVLFSIMYFLE
jgi:hypothetical protein